MRGGVGSRSNAAADKEKSIQGSRCRCIGDSDKGTVIKVEGSKEEAKTVVMESCDRLIVVDGAAL